MLVEQQKDKLFWDIENGIIFSNFITMKDLIEEYGLKKSSDIMYAILYVYDWESPFATMVESERIEQVEKEVLQEEGFFEDNEHLIGKAIEFIQKLQETSEIRYIKSLEKMMEERRVLLENTPVTIQNIKAIDDALKNSDILLEKKDLLLARLKGSGENEVKGGQRLSLLAKGVIKIK